MSDDRRQIERLAEDARRGDLSALATWTRAALRSADRHTLDAVVEVLEATWRETPHLALADALEALSPAVESPDATALRDHPKKKIPAADWLRVAEHDRAADRAALTETAARGSMAVIRGRVARMIEWPADPRVSRGLARWLLDLPFRATSSQKLWLEIFELIVAGGDHRIVAVLEPVRADDWTWPCGATMARWLGERVPELLERLEGWQPPSADAGGALAELGALGQRTDLERLGDTESDAAVQSRAALPAAIGRLPRLRAWLDVLHHADAIRQADDLDGWVEQIDIATRAFSGRLFPTPDKWWDGLWEPETMAHPLLPLTRHLDLGTIPSKVSATRVAKILRRSELQRVSSIQIVTRNLTARVVAAILALPALEVITLEPMRRDTDLAKLAKVPELAARLRELVVDSELGFSKRAPRAADLRTVADAGGLANLERLVLATGTAEHRAVVRDAAPSRLHTLCLSLDRPDGARALIAALPALRDLTIDGRYQICDMIEDGLLDREASPRRDVRFSTWLLRDLSGEDVPRFSRYRFDIVTDEWAGAVDAFLTRHGESLEETVLHGPGAAMVSALTRMPNLRRLEIDWVKGDAASRLRGIEPTWPDLRVLSMRNVDGVDRVLEHLLRRPLPALRTVIARDRIGGHGLSAGFAAIVALETPLEHLGVHIALQGRAGPLRDLCGSHHRESLATLDFGWSTIDHDGVDLIFGTEWPRLARLHLGHNTFDNPMIDRIVADGPLRARAQHAPFELDLSDATFPRARRTELRGAWGDALVL